MVSRARMSASREAKRGNNTIILFIDNINICVPQRESAFQRGKTTSLPLMFFSSYSSSSMLQSIDKLADAFCSAAYVRVQLPRDKPMTRRFVEGIDLCEETDLSRFDHISRGSSSRFIAREALLAVDGRDINAGDLDYRRAVVPELEKQPAEIKTPRKMLI